MSVEQTVFCKRINKMMSADAMTRCDDCVDGQEYVADLTKQLADKDRELEVLHINYKNVDGCLAKEVVANKDLTKQLAEANPMGLTQEDAIKAIWIAPNGEMTSLPPSTWKEGWFPPQEPTT